MTTIDKKTTRSNKLRRLIPLDLWASILWVRSERRPLYILQRLQREPLPWMFLHFFKGSSPNLGMGLTTMVHLSAGHGLDSFARHLPHIGGLDSLPVQALSKTLWVCHPSWLGRSHAVLYTYNSDIPDRLWGLQGGSALDASAGYELAVMVVWLHLCVWMVLFVCLNLSGLGWEGKLQPWIQVPSRDNLHVIQRLKQDCKCECVEECKLKEATNAKWGATRRSCATFKIV